MLVSMVGDGGNHVPVLARADVGLAIGSGTDVAIESGNVVLDEDDPLDVRLIQLSKASYRKMQETLVWATGSIVFALSLAAGVLVPYVVLLSSAIGAVFVSASRVIVTIDAWRPIGVTSPRG